MPEQTLPTISSVLKLHMQARQACNVNHKLAARRYSISYISALESLPEEQFSLKEECAVQIQSQGDKGGQEAICGKRLSEL